jgi:ketosteroid isomerase-like protein
MARIVATRTKRSPIARQLNRLNAPLLDRSSPSTRARIRRAVRRLPPDQQTAMFWETLTDAWEAWATGDVERLLLQYAPDCLLDFSQFGIGFESPVVRGHDEIRRFLADWAETWDNLRRETRSISVADDGTIFDEFHQSGVARGSRIEVELACWQVVEWDDRGVTRLATYTEKEPALADLAQVNAAPART